MKPKFKTSSRLEPRSYTLIDFSALAYSIYFRCVFILNKKWDGEKQPSAEMMYKQLDGKIKSIISITKHPPIMVLDHGRSDKNELLGGGYKEQRKPLPINPVKILGEYASKKWTCCFCYGEEADDCIASISYKIKEYPHVVVCSDQDLYQLKRKNCKLLHINKLQWIKKKDLINKYGLNRWRKIVWYKVLFGDVSDNIPTLLYRVRRQPVIDVLNKCSSFKQIKVWAKSEYGLKRQQLSNRFKAIKLRKNLDVKVLKTCANFFDYRV